MDSVAVACHDLHTRALDALDARLRSENILFRIFVCDKAYKTAHRSEISLSAAWEADV